MAEVRIHRCTLRVVRRRGWSWGADPRRLLRAAVAALPALLERKLSELLPDDEELDIAAPVRLAVSLRLSELLALAEAPALSTTAHDSPAARTIAARLARAIETALPTKTVADEEARSAEESERARDRREEDESQATPSSADVPLLRLLLAWRARGELELHLATLGETALAVWHRALIETTHAAAVALPPEAIRKLAREVSSRLRARVRGRASALRLRIVAVVECVERWQLSPGDAALAEVFDEAFAWAGAADADAATPPAPDAVRQAEPDTLPATRGPSRPPPAPPVPHADARVEPARVSKDAEFAISSALPFLLLGPLARVGYWETLAGSLEAARLTHESHLFAAALAYKVLTPPARGWRRTPEDERAAAVFAGLDEPPKGSSLTEFARRFSSHLAPLDSVLAHALAQGHSPGRPVLLHRAVAEGAEGELVLFDTEGLFAVACADDWPSLAPAARYFSETPVLVHSSSADPALLRELDAAGFTFITDAAPARGERLRELRRTPAERWYTNDTGARVAPLIHAATGIARAAEEAELLWGALVRERAGVPLARESRLERSLTLAAALGLGATAWTLWREREFSTPLLALERFGDLDARVRFGDGSVRVTLPLGRRRADLERAGLLADVRGVPWLGRRVVSFADG